MFTFSVVFVCEFVSMPTVGIKCRSLIKVMLCPIYVFPYNHIIYTSKRARALQREKIWHTLTFYSSLPGLSLHVLRCNNIINYQTALGVFVSGTTVRMIDNMSITSLKKVVAVMTGMAKRIYDAH